MPQPSLHMGVDLKVFRNCTWEWLIMAKHDRFRRKKHGSKPIYIYKLIYIISFMYIIIWVGDMYIIYYIYIHIMCECMCDLIYMQGCQFYLAPPKANSLAWLQAAKLRWGREGWPFLWQRRCLSFCGPTVRRGALGTCGPYTLWLFNIAMENRHF